MIVIMMGSAMPAITNFPLERPIFMREYASGSYGTIPYAVSKMLIEIPFEFIRSILVILILYWLESLQGNFILLALVCWVMAITSISISILAGAAVKDPK